MAKPLLFDISGIDRSEVAIAADDVGRINPQCGDMRQLCHVIWHNDDATEFFGVKHVREDEFWVAGHIPGRPLMPGVLMIEAAAQLCSVMFQHKVTEPLGFLGFTRCDEVVFRGQVVPGDTLHLLAKEVSRRPRRFISLAQAVVGDDLVFEGRITGMVV